MTTTEQGTDFKQKPTELDKNVMFNESRGGAISAIEPIA